jgi:peptide/nickel transport system substrate-binding protein
MQNNPSAKLRRRTVLAGAAALLASPAIAQSTRPTTLRFVPSANLSFTDPSISTAGVTINHGFAVFDCLYGVDAQNRPKPQMVEGHSVSADNLTWTFRLREGLKFHDNTPVRGADCIASIKRWGARDSFGQALLAFTASMDAPDDRTFRILLKRPMGVVVDALAHSAPTPLFVMPERLASTDPFKPVTEIIGSGPFRFSAADYVPGSRMVYIRNDSYIPRSETPEWTSGAKRAWFERVEWTVIPDASTAAAALQRGEVDWIEAASLDLAPQLAKNPALTVRNTSPFGLGSVARFNFAQPPFNNPTLRRIVRDAITQEDYLRSIHGDDSSSYSTCYSAFLCGLPGVTEYAKATMGAPKDYAKLASAVKAAVKAAGYNGEKVVIINPVDYAVLSNQGLITAETLRKIGFNVEVDDMDFGTMLQRRTSKAPAGQGGWSIFHTSAAALSLANPAISYFTRGVAEGGWPGSYISPEAERLVDTWMSATSDEARQTAFDAAQRLALDDVAIVPLGFWRPKTAYRRDITGVVPCDYALFWNARRA